MGDDGYISSLVEKQVISSTFGCGSYSFETAVDYCNYFEAISSKGNLFLSDIIYQNSQGLIDHLFLNFYLLFYLRSALSTLDVIHGLV